jgi:hypothetical protein
VLTAVHQAELGTIWGQFRREMRAERCSGRRDALIVWMQIPLRRDKRAVSGDLPQHADGNPGVSHPSQSSVPQIVPAQMLVTELRHNLVPVRRA